MTTGPESFHKSFGMLPQCHFSMLARQARELPSLMTTFLPVIPIQTMACIKSLWKAPRENSEMQILSVLSTRLTWLLLPYSTLDIPTGSRSLKLHIEKPLGNKEKGLWTAPMSLEDSCKLEVSFCSDLHEIRYPYIFQHTP